MTMRDDQPPSSDEADRARTKALRAAQSKFDRRLREVSELLVLSMSLYDDGIAPGAALRHDAMLGDAIAFHGITFAEGPYRMRPGDRAGIDRDGFYARHSPDDPWRFLGETRGDALRAVMRERERAST